MSRASFLASLLVAGCLACGCAGVHPEDRDRDPSQAMEAVLRAQEAAWNRGDVDTFMSEGYLRSPTLTFYSSAEIRRGYDTLLEHYRESYTQGGREMGHLTFGGIETVVLGPDGGLARGSWRLDFHDGRTTGGLFSLVMQRTREGWRIVHDHTSVAEKG